MAVSVSIAENRFPAKEGQAFGQFSAVISLWPHLPADFHAYQGSRLFL